jgi:hypothetical protein
MSLQLTWLLSRRLRSQRRANGRQATELVVMPLQVVVIFPIAIAFSPRYPSNDDVCRYRWERTDRSVEVVTG